MISPSLIDRYKVDHALEAVCQLGCVRVKEAIREIEQGTLPDVAMTLNEAERRHLLKELREIMDTYL